MDYQFPPRQIQELLDAPGLSGFSLSPDRTLLALLEPLEYPPISFLAQPELRLAQVYVNPERHTPARISKLYKDIKLIEIKSNEELPIRFPAPDMKIIKFAWSPDGTTLAFTHLHDTGISLWILDTKTGETKSLIETGIHALYGMSFVWKPDSRHILCKIIPLDRKNPPIKPSIPAGPAIQESIGQKSPTITFQDLIRTHYEEDLLEYYLQTQLALVDLKGRVKHIGEADAIKQAIPSPNGQYVLVKKVEKPFAYTVPVYRFPHRLEVWDMDGNVVRVIGWQPLDDSRPSGRDGCSPGPRLAGWRADSPATVYWAEAQDGGNHHLEVQDRDRLFTLTQPFEGNPHPMMTLEYRFKDIHWSEEGTALVEEAWWRTRRRRVWMFRPDEAGEKHRLVFDLSLEDRYMDPGDPLHKATPSGTYVLLTGKEDRSIFLAGEGASLEGDRPFLDELDLDTFERKRLWQSKPPCYEIPISLIDPQKGILLIRREAVEEPPNFFIRNLCQDSLVPVTAFSHPYPGIKGLHKELITYQREDGVHLSANLYLPPGYSIEQGRLPVLIWAYPREYKDPATAGQVKGSPCQFMRLHWGSSLYWLVCGYAVLDGPQMPIIGEGKMEPNDTYLEQLVAGAGAAVKAIVDRGIADPGRIAIGGHSYGAFMAVNLLIHSDLFQTAIARTGAYNRTLTPFGFQGEERSLWEAQDTYLRMTPMLHLDKLNKPLLLIHGEDDNNAGTSPLQSQFLFHALKGLGKKARLVFLPREGHHYRARESILHMAWEITRWLDIHLRGKGWS
jgi:dipeptidyl aminopeptidase/acylaminoacyl peptidase